MMLKVQFRSSFKETFELSGITKLGNFSGHSTQSASTPKASFAGLSVSDILWRGSWSKQSTWQNFYNNYILSNQNMFKAKVFESRQKDGFK